MNNIEDFKDILLELSSCSSEEEVLNTIKMIVKTFNVSMYKSILMENPYFKELVPEVKIEVIDGLLKIKDSIKLEIYNIDKELLNPVLAVEFKKLKILRVDCVFLLKGIEDKLKDLDTLI